ncbi:MAG: 16S rRNA (guanine(966)-N(2))-methyltransferase RsmD [Myxococcales bacterium]|nr:16S rRNA (guanine(966)-N(2))-methyltransferase RsmD [Myxococcales bacterium]
MVRIIAGSFRGRRLAVPEGDSVRPTGDRVREALFSALDARLSEGFQGKRVLDICAGSGALGIEAMSRGAASVVLLERDPVVCATVRKNLTLTGLRPDVARLERTDALAYLRKPPSLAFDVVFFDPPYASGLYDEVIERLAANGWLTPTALLVVEHPSALTPRSPESLKAVWSRRYGETSLTLFAPLESEAP